MSQMQTGAVLGLQQQDLGMAHDGSYLCILTDSFS